MQVSEILERRRTEAVQRRDRRVQKLFEAHPELAEIRQKKQKKLMETLSLALNQDPEALKKARAALQRLETQEARLLEQVGVSASFFEPDYTCPDCHDEGFVHGVSCHCRNALLASERYAMSAVAQRIDRENFRTFDLSLFRRDRQPSEPMSPYENMRMLREQMEDGYVKHFSAESPNLYFFGPTGTGKTFLVNCIVKGTLDRGARVFYQTAPALLNFLVGYSYTNVSARSSADESRFHFAHECDLLVVDDLGTEYTNGNMVAELFDLLNDRIVSGRPTIISSNLQPQELGEVYNDRIASRITGEYLMFEVFGSDLRRS